MRNFKVLLTTLVVGLVAHVAVAAGTAELVVMPVEQAAKHISKTYKIAEEEAMMIANTIIKGTELSLGRTIPANQVDFTKLLNLPGNERLKRAFDMINVEKLNDISDVDLGKLANEIGAIVDSSKRAADVCRTCGITDTLFHRFGLRIFIPLDVETSMAVLKNTPNDLNVVVRDLDQLNKRGTIKGASQTELLKLLQSSNDAQRLTKHDLRKAHFALKSLDGSNGPEAKAAAETFIAMAGGNIFSENRIALTIADFADEGAEGKATLAELSDIARKIEGENSTPKARAQAFCKHFADVARGKPEREASFRKLQRCPNYQLVFNACSL
ncbi:MAG: hypothetical protein ABIR96_01110 [Bdellovibrionota bacterium]